MRIRLPSVTLSFLDMQIKAEDCLKLEEERVSNYMHQSSRTSLLKEVETEILQQHQTTLLEKEQSGCAALLQDDKVTWHTTHASAAMLINPPISNVKVPQCCIYMVQKVHTVQVSCVGTVARHCYLALLLGTVAWHCCLALLLGTAIISTLLTYLCTKF